MLWYPLQKRIVQEGESAMNSFKEKEYNVFEMFSRQWALVTAGTIEHFNTCTIGWGSMGTIWDGADHGRSIVTVYVHPDRFTWEYLKECSLFTVSFYPETYRKALGYLGSHSGRNEDKVAAVGFTPKELGGGVTFAEAELSFVCRKLYQGPFEREGLAAEIDRGIYRDWAPHWMFIGQIIESEDCR